MTNRVIASTVAASLALRLAGCHPQCNGDDFRGGVGLAEVVGLPIYIAYCASRAHGATDETRAAAEARTAAEKVRAAAEKGDAEAQFDLGAVYELGQGVPKDDAEAAKWYQKSADQGFGEAQFALGLMYEAGRGVEQDNVQADIWYTIAASAEKTTATTTTEKAIKWHGDIEAHMTPEQIAEARKRAQEWKPS